MLPYFFLGSTTAIHMTLHSHDSTLFWNIIAIMYISGKLTTLAIFKLNTTLSLVLLSSKPVLQILWHTTSLQLLAFMFLFNKLLSGKSTLSALYIALATIIIVTFKSYEIGVEPLVYFFTISEISGLFVLFVLGLRKVSSWSNHTPVSLVMLPLICVLIGNNTCRNNLFFFNFLQQMQFTVFNDFQCIFYTIFLLQNNLIVIFTLVYTYTAILIYTYTSFLLKDPNRKFNTNVSNNLNVFKKNIFKK